MSEASLQEGQVFDDVGASSFQGFGGLDLTVGLHTEFEGGIEWMRDLNCSAAIDSIRPEKPYLVGCEEDSRVLEELVAEEVAKSVVFLVEGEDGSARSTCDRSEKLKTANGIGTKWSTYEGLRPARFSSDHPQDGTAHS